MKGLSQIKRYFNIINDLSARPRGQRLKGRAPPTWGLERSGDRGPGGRGHQPRRDLKLSWNLQCLPRSLGAHRVSVTPLQEANSIAVKQGLLHLKKQGSWPVTAPWPLSPKQNSLSFLATPRPSAYVHDFILGPKIRHQDVLPVGHPGERDEHFAGNEPVDVGREVSAQALSDLPAHVEGRMQDAHVPSPGAPDKVEEDSNHLVCGGRGQTHKGTRPWRWELLCGKTRNPLEVCVPQGSHPETKLDQRCGKGSEAHRTNAEYLQDA